MPTELLTSKLFIPLRRQSLVQRPRLIQLLNEGLYARRKLSLISAPAGFGKTTLVVDWLKQNNLPAAWLSVEEVDNDLPRFLTYLVAALQLVDEEIGTSLLNALQSALPQAIEKHIAVMLNEIALRTDPLILVLDDYHLISEETILKAVEFILHHLPPQLHLVLTTREDPDLPLARLRARDQITEIRAGDLRFTQGEAEIFLRSVMGLTLSDQDVASLEARTEGWAAGLQLAGLSMQKQANLKSFIAEFSGSNRHILDYLTNEVIQRQPDEIRSFLLQTSILDRLCGPLCDALTLRNDSSHLIEYLDSANLFAIPLDEDRHWYRYHHLFSNMLHSQLVRLQPEMIPVLHQRASRWYEENGDIRAAVEHAFQDPDLTRASQLVEHYAIPRLYRGEVTMTMDWCGRLPETVFLSAPMLCICKAWSLVLTQREMHAGEVELALQTAERALDNVNAGKDLRDQIAGHMATIRAFALRTTAKCGEKPEDLIALAREALQLLPQQEKAIRSVNDLNIGFAYLELADLNAAETAYKQAMEDGIAGGNLFAAVYGPINMATSLLLGGHLREALQLCNTNIERFNKLLAGQNFPPIGALYILKGSIFLEFDRLTEAKPVLMEGLDLIRWTGEYEGPKTGYTALARLYAIQGDRPAMLESVKTLEDIWPDGAFYAQALRHRLSMRYWPDDPDLRRDAQTWLTQSGIEYEKLDVFHSVDPMSTVCFESNLNAVYTLLYLEMEGPGTFPLACIHAYLTDQLDFAEAHGIVSWVVAVEIARTLFYQATGKMDKALESLEAALRAAAPTGLFRIFEDECGSLHALLAELRPRLQDTAVIAYTNRLMATQTSETKKPETGQKHEIPLSERELEVLDLLAKGLTYEVIGQQLFLSLNTIQFHVKNIYSKLMVNKRVQALQKAREMNLI